MGDTVIDRKNYKINSGGIPVYQRPKTDITDGDIRNAVGTTSDYPIPPEAKNTYLAPPLASKDKPIAQPKQTLIATQKEKSASLTDASIQGNIGKFSYGPEGGGNAPLATRVDIGKKWTNKAGDAGQFVSADGNTTFLGDPRKYNTPEYAVSAEAKKDLQGIKSYKKNDWSDGSFNMAMAKRKADDDYNEKIWKVRRKEEEDAKDNMTVADHYRALSRSSDTWDIPDNVRMAMAVSNVQNRHNVMKERSALEGHKIQSAERIAAQKYITDENNKTRQHDIAMKHEDRKSAIAERSALRKDNDEIKHETARNNLLSRIQQRETELATKKRDGSVPVEEITELQRLLDEDRYHAMKYGSDSEKQAAAQRYNEVIKRRRDALVGPAIKSAAKAMNPKWSLSSPFQIIDQSANEIATKLMEKNPNLTEEDMINHLPGYVPERKREALSSSNPASKY